MLYCIFVYIPKLFYYWTIANNVLKMLQCKMTNSVCHHLPSCSWVFRERSRGAPTAPCPNKARDTDTDSGSKFLDDVESSLFKDAGTTVHVILAIHSQALLWGENRNAWVKKDMWKPLSLPLLIPNLQIWALCLLTRSITMLSVVLL